GATSSAFTVANAQVSDNGSLYTVVVTNNAGNVASDAAILAVTVASIEVGDGAATRTIRVEEPGAWTAEADAPWLNVSPSEGSGVDAVEIAIEANASDADRVGTFTVAGVAYTVTQRAPGSG